MEEKDQQKVREAVEQILAEADIETISEKQVRELAATRTGVALSSPEGKKFVLNVIKRFLEFGGDGGVPEAQPDVVAVEAAPAVKNGTQKKKKKRNGAEQREGKGREDDHEQESEADEDEAQPEGKKPKFEMDDEGNIIICELSAKRKVVVSQWKGKALVSLREYYEKDGKMLPTSKGISLTVEQFEVLAKKANDIEAAIASLQ